MPVTTEQFIEKAKLVHGDEYDYSKTEYVLSKHKVIIICKIHGEFLQVAGSHIQGYKCKRCSIDNTKKTNIAKYGVTNPAQSKEIKEKIEQTNIKKYGCKSPFGNKIVQEKSKKTMLDRYGCESALGNKEIYAKVKATNLEKYGVKSPSQSKEIQEKIKKTNLERYGVEHTFQSNNNKEKTKKTNLERYGVEYSAQNKGIQEKKKQRNLETYGVDWPWQKSVGNFFSKDWLFEQYIVLGKTAIQIADENGVNKTTALNYLHKHEIEIRYAVGYSMKSIQWLESIMKQEGIFIQHAGNIGEFKIPNTRYRVDGYCQETNTVYEFHGDIFHGNPDLFEDHEQCHTFNNLTAKELYTKTKERENKIKELGYNLVVMWENDFKLKKRFDI